MPQPLSRPALLDRLTDLVRAHGHSRPLRVAVDGPTVAGGAALAADLADRLRTSGRPAVHVPAAGFLRPASVRFERGRDDPDAYFDDALDLGALWREVLTPLGPGGDRRYLPSRWDRDRDRATRAPRATAPLGAVVLVEGVFLLRPQLAGGFDLTVHLRLSPRARLRRVPAVDAARELPAYDRYDAEVAPAESADLVVLWDDPARPALLSRLGDQP